MKWQSGAPMSLPSRVLALAFVLCCAVGGVAGSVEALEPLALPALVAGLVAAVLTVASGSLDARRHRESTARRFEANTLLHGTALTQDALNLPPEEIPVGDTFRLFDHFTGDHLGNVSGRQLQGLLTAHRKLMPENNDLYIIEESIEVLRSELDGEMIAILEKAFATHDDIELRWAPGEA